jgi:hypothetical protein
MKYERLLIRWLVYTAIAGLMIIVFPTLPAFALHPLITDDTGTQGKGGVEVEMGFEHDHDDFRWIDSNPESILSSTLTGQSSFGNVLSRDDINIGTLTVAYGIIDNLDVIIGLPYFHVKTKERRLYYTGPMQGLTYKSTSTSSGLSDVNTEFKWKFYEYKVISLALKPGVIFPVGDSYRGLGAGRFGGYAYFISTVDLTPVLIHLNLGYIRNQTNHLEREDIYHASLAFEFWLVKDYLRFVTNCVLERNRYKWSNINDVTAVGGIVVSPTENCDIDVGFRWRFSQKGTQHPGADYSVPIGIYTRADYSILCGITVRFGGTSAVADNDNKEVKKEGGK